MANNVDFPSNDQPRIPLLENEWSDDDEVKIVNRDHKNNVNKPMLLPETLVKDISDEDGARIDKVKDISDEDGERIDKVKDISDEDGERIDKVKTCDVKSQENDTLDGLVGGVEGIDNVEGDDIVEDGEERKRVHEVDTLIKPKKRSMQCKECGKRFNRRETFNLHRHFHAHEDLTPLTCKECNMTFQHRSSLIKHRSEHKEKEEQIIASKKEANTREGRGLKCAQCEKCFSTVEKLRDHNCNRIPEKPYRCPLCRQEFQFKLSITKHMQTHSLENVFACQECSQHFPDSKSLRCHQRSHAALKPYECPECGMVFKHYSVMEDHRRKHTENMRSHQCNICGKTFKYSSLLHQHQYLHTGQKPFRCPECGKTFAFAQNMKAHYRQHRLSTTTSPPSSDQASKHVPMPTHETINGLGKENTNQADPIRVFNCPLCPQTFLTPANLRAHMLIHEAEFEKLENTPTKETKSINWEKGYKCPHCPSVFRDRRSYYGHLLKVHKSVSRYLDHMATEPIEKYIPDCANNFQGKRRNDACHIKSHKCPQCSKLFRHRSVLELHMRIHSKDKPFQCKVCGKGFRFGSYLQQHLIIHTGEKPHKCPDCGKDFAFLQNMKTHQKLHQAKPFRCSSCRKGYSDEVQLKRHMLSHNGDKPHKCNLCDKSFGLAYLLRDHMNTHTGERPHRCDECHKSFSWFSSLLVHQKIHARKKQGFNPYNSFTGGIRTRGRERRGTRFASSWSRPVVSSGMVASQTLYKVPTSRDTEWYQSAFPSQTTRQSAQMELQVGLQKETWSSETCAPPVQWKVDGGEVLPVQLAQHSNPATVHAQLESSLQPGLQQHHERRPGWVESTLATLSDPSSINCSETLNTKESSTLGSCSLQTAMPKTLTCPSVVSDLEKHRQAQPETWSGMSNSAAMASTSSSSHNFPVSTTYIDGAALWSVKPNPVASTSQIAPSKLSQELQLSRWSGAIQKSGCESPFKKDDKQGWDFNTHTAMQTTVSQAEKRLNGGEVQKQWAPNLAGVSSSAQLDQSKAVLSSTPASLELCSTLWDFQTPTGIQNTSSPSNKLGGNQEFQLLQKPQSCWTNQTSTQEVPMSLPYEPHHFARGLGPAVWGFQTNHVGPQALLPGHVKQGNAQELQHQPMVTGTQIILNPPSPFFSPPLAPLPPLALPGPHPLHSVGALARPTYPNIFFTPQAVMSEGPHMPQTLPLPQLTPRTGPHKLGGRLPFAPERLLQCMICGHSLPREMDLQMHYLQHAQGEI